MTVRDPAALREVAQLFLRLGITAFGGPAAHIAMMRDEVVRRRRWVNDARFLDLLGATNLIPGPNSTEMAIHLGYVRAGWAGLIVGGVLFIVPAMLIVLALAWAYVRYGTTPEAVSLLYGITPVVIAIVAQALWGLARTAVKGWRLAVIGTGVLALYLAGANEIALLFGGGLAALAMERAGVWSRRPAAMVLLSAAAAATPPVAVASGASLAVLVLTFLKIGAVLYGSGYVLLAFLRNDFVHRLGWLTDRQLLDAVAVGQFTPGPVFTTATFVGYLVGGVTGALLATGAIFLPSFVFVAASGPLLPRLRRSPAFGVLLDGVNVAALGLMAGVAWQLGRAAIVDVPTVTLAVGALLLLIRFRLNSAWLIAAGGMAGLLVQHLR
jgi:chromate transporter